jgi:cytochrome c oxidase cbb3-type subunit 1
VVGHAHLVMFGVFSLWLYGIMTYLFPRILHRPWASQNLLEWHYWLSTAGIVTMFTDLTLAGVFQGYWWGSLQPWEDSTDGSFPFWVVRVVAGLMMFGGLLCFITNIYKTWTSPAAPAEPAAA